MLCSAPGTTVGAFDDMLEVLLDLIIREIHHSSKSYPTEIVAWNTNPSDNVEPRHAHHCTIKGSPVRGGSSL